MNSIERMASVFKGQRPDRIPFVPTIYEHAAAVINRTPSELARDEDLLVCGQLQAFERYRHDLVVVGMDIYNVEAEALGCLVEYYDSWDIPGVVRHLLADEPERLAALRLPNPETAGRMPLILNAASRVKETIGNEVGVNGSLVGPFTLAALLRGFENFIFDLMLNTAYARDLLEFTTALGIAFGSAMADRKLGVSINESWIAPPLLSPKLYEEFVFPCHVRMIRELQQREAPSVGLISGGNTTPIAGLLVKTGSSILLADYNTDLAHYKKLAVDHGVVLRGSVASQLVERGSSEEIERTARDVLAVGAPGGSFIMGCGVVSYHTKPENLIQLKQAVEQFSDY